MRPAWLGAQPKRCGKEKEFELCGENGKGNRFYGTIWAVGTGITPVLGGDFSICYLFLSPGFPRNVMHPYFEQDQNVKLILRHFAGI